MAKRARCDNCLKASSACICHTIKAINNVHRLHILQDPSEEKKAIGTARILKLSLKNVQLSVGELFNEQEFDLNNCYLLFPSDEAISATQCNKQFRLNDQSVFILLDGSWKKAYKLLMSNPFLQALPRVSIDADAKSNYRLRKSPRDDGLSTVEAGYYLLSQLEDDTDKFFPLLESFEYMIDYQISKMPADLYRRHYLDKTKD
ncbi:DTW domain-containing protein [Psychromonas sp. psych-6C06]|uniref:tRNA-uridine aminocarboxypropyltransferase n=1 Tax=Psychromonas sp. psych-6C06 TaxID=2058089 RepID=UPI000C34C0DC|nr:tRNA-uridine aminocarboxypropyltransferase [Psychromonas sp. psych-6C06]PKF62756.1 DTW domain-containing protein [Psychromonas sp. psych-6C06]